MKISTTEKITKEFEITTKKQLNFINVSYGVKMSIGGNMVSITNQDGEPFKFENVLNQKNLERWKIVIKLISEAIKIAEKELNQK